MTGGPATAPARGAGIYDWVTGAAVNGGAWFPPGEPLPPIAQRTAGRAWDYPMSLNMQYQPKRGEGVSFGDLRRLADAYDLLRLAIETRKDEMELFEWNVQARGGKETGGSKRLQGFLASPDGEHTWHQWQRMLLEELFVTDAPAIYVRRTNGGDPYSLEIVDGGTIKRLLDETGRTPEEGPAYQQVLHGMVAANFDRSELIYCPRNVRVNRVYGYSPVEQVMTTVDIALRRQAHQLSYYTEGSVPDLMFQVPEGWDAKQIQEFQTWWASLFSEGNIANRRMARFVPHGVTPFNTKEAALKDQYDEWLARIICFAFSISNQALVAQVNRATAEVAEETAKSSGLEPIKNWFKGLMDRVLADVYGEPGLEFAWLPKDSLSPVEQAQIHATYVQCGVMGANEVREAIGLEARKDGSELRAAGRGPGIGAPDAQPPDTGAALSDSQVSSLVQIVEAAAAGALPKESAMQIIRAAFPCLSEASARGMVGPLEEPPKALHAARGTVPPTEKLSKVGPAAITIDHSRRPIRCLTAELQDLLGGAFAGKRDAIKEWLADSGGPMPAFEGRLADFNPLLGGIENILGRAAKSGGSVALNGLRGHLGDNSHRAFTDLANRVNRRAAAWAREASARLVAEISDTTRESLEKLVADGVADGLGADELAAAIFEAHALSKERAETMAVTEIAEADVGGNRMAYAESGVLGAEAQAAHQF